MNLVETIAVYQFSFLNIDGQSHKKFDLDQT